MEAKHLGPWEPLTVDEAAALFKPAEFRWWLSGGCALEVHLESSWRDHTDIDIGICRGDVAALHRALGGWDIHVAADGVLTPWDGRPLTDPSDHAANNLWCRPAPDRPWALDILLGDGTDQEWIYRRDPAIRRPWPEAVLTTADGLPYLAPELQLLFKSKTVRPKDAVDGAEVIPRLAPDRRSWLARHLGPDHVWQTIIAGERAGRAVRAIAGERSDVTLLATGRSSQAWSTVHTANDGRAHSVVRVPMPNSGRFITYRAESRIGDLLADGGHPVSRWRITAIDEVECAVGEMLAGQPIPYEGRWTPAFVERLAALLRDLHRLPTTGWGPLGDRGDRLNGSSGSATEGIVDRWFHATMWPFDGTELETHPVSACLPDLVPLIASHQDRILTAASAPFGLVHSDLHNQHLLQVDGELTGVLDFGDAFIGSTAWDFALLRWYYGAENTERLAAAYDSGDDLAERGALLAVAVGCYKVAKSPGDPALPERLRALLTG